MPVIHLITKIKAPASRCFDLSRSIDLHKLSTEGTQEQAIAGVTTGLIGPGETVTWLARHFGVFQKLTTLISDYKYPHYFKSSMLKGTFRKIEHSHFFLEEKGVTTMQDVFDFEAPFGLPGKMISYIILLPYMKNLLVKRNALIRQTAESDDWQKLPGMLSK